MKISEAEEKVCPFMSVPTGDFEKGFQAVMCMTENCIAWTTYKTHEQIKNIPEDDSKKSCMTEFRNGKKLSRDNCEGSCKKLQQRY